MKQSHQRSHGKIVAALLQSYEDSTLQPLLENLGLDKITTRRLTYLLVLHLLLDRLLTFTLSIKLLKCSTAEQSPRADEMLKQIASLAIPKRVVLARELGLLSSQVADSIVGVNRVRNNLVHFKPKTKGAGWKIGEIPEIATESSFEQCKQNAIKAIMTLVKRFES